VTTFLRIIVTPASWIALCPADEQRRDEPVARAEEVHERAESPSTFASRESAGEKYNRSAMRNRAEIQYDPLTPLGKLENLGNNAKQWKNNEDAMKEAMGVA
jgi:hypothetical protein